LAFALSKDPEKIKIKLKKKLKPEKRNKRRREKNPAAITMAIYRGLTHLYSFPILPHVSNYIL